MGGQREGGEEELELVHGSEDGAAAVAGRLLFRDDRLWGAALHTATNILLLNYGSPGI
jgi:hypothetical protein